MNTPSNPQGVALLAGGLKAGVEAVSGAIKSGAETVRKAKKDEFENGHKNAGAWTPEHMAAMGDLLMKHTELQGKLASASQTSAQDHEARMANVHNDFAAPGTVVKSRTGSSSVSYTSRGEAPAPAPATEAARAPKPKMRPSRSRRGGAY
jgi:hypothetical protein